MGARVRNPVTRGELAVDSAKRAIGFLDDGGKGMRARPRLPGHRRLRRRGAIRPPGRDGRGDRFDDEDVTAARSVFEKSGDERAGVIGQLVDGERGGDRAFRRGYAQDRRTRAP